MALCPAATVAEPDDPDATPSVKSLAVPVSATLWGLAGALSVTFSVAERPPPLVGLKLTLMVQVAPAGTLDPQLFCWLKSPVSAPPILMLEMASGAVPEFVKLTALAMLPWPVNSAAKLRRPGARATAGWVPVPVSATDCGLPAALSATVTVPLIVPADFGSKSSVMVQLAPTAIDPLHGLTSAVPIAKSALAVMLVMLSAAEPVLVRVTFCVALDVPTGCEPKLKLAGEKLATGAGVMPVPVSATTCGLPAALSMMLIDPVRAPATDGVKVTLIVQLAPGASVEPQMVVSLKSTLLLLMLVMSAVTTPEFVRVIV